MTKLINKPDAEFFTTKNREGKLYEDIKIEYPFCYKDNLQKNYFRYLEDGRFENIVLEDNRHGIVFGTFTNSINGLINENDFWLKIVANLNTIIDNDEFETALNTLFIRYDKYRKAEMFVALQVEKIIKLKELEEFKAKEVLDKKKEEEEIKFKESVEELYKGDDDEIISGETNEDEPF